MNRERAIIHAVQFFRFFEYKWYDEGRGEYIPDATAIEEVFNSLTASAYELAKKNKSRMAYAGSGRLMVLCNMVDGEVDFEYYIGG